jgi:hypothetical protein
VSLSATNAARKITSIPARDKFVLMALSDYADDRGRAWPRHSTLAAWTCLSRSSVIRALENLEHTHKLIASTRRTHDTGAERSKEYQLLFIEGADFESAEDFGDGGVTQGVYQADTGGVSPGHTLNGYLNDQKEQEHMSAAPTPAPRSKAAPKEELGSVDDLVAAWNENCGALPSVKTVSPARRKRLLAYRVLAGEDAVETLRRATLVVAADDWWIRGKYGLDNLLAGDKVFQRAEQYEAKHASEVLASVRVGDAVEFEYQVGARVERLSGVVELMVGEVQVRVRVAGGPAYLVHLRDVRRK